MSKKRFNPLEDPPNASSSDEDNDEMEAAGNSSSEEEETDDESSLKKPESAAPEKKKHQPSDSGSGSGSDEETDSDSQTERKNSSAVKSITGTKDSAVVVVAKKNHDSDKKVKPLTKCSTKKRSLSDTDGAAAEAKKAKTGSGTGEESAKKSYFQRVWSEEDEIAALQGLIDYRDETGASPYDDTNAFYLFVKKSISFDVSKTQLLKKLWGLKTKYENNLGKEKNGEEVAFSKPHDRKAFDLSKLFWGGDGVALDSAVKSNGKSKKSSKSSSSSKKVEEPEKVALDSANGKSKKSSKSSSSAKKVEPEKQELASSSPNGKSCEDKVVTNKGEGEVDDAFEKSVLVKAVARFGVDDITAQQGWSKLALEDKKRFEEEWKVLQLRELELYSQKSGFIHEVVTKMADSFQPNP